MTDSPRKSMVISVRSIMEELLEERLDATRSTESLAAMPTAR